MAQPVRQWVVAWAARRFSDRAGGRACVPLAWWVSSCMSVTLPRQRELRTPRVGRQTVPLVRFARAPRAAPASARQRAARDRAAGRRHMATLPDRAKVVVIGAGIVGNSMAWHLARLGWREIVLLEKGTLPSPGGSTGHASNFIFLTDHSKEMTAFTLDSTEQYKEMGVFTQSGGIEVARTPQRMEELKRRVAWSKSCGIESELVTPARVKELDRK